MDKELKALLCQTLIVYPFKTTNKFNENDYNTPINVPCRVEIHNKMIVDEKGETVLSNCRIFIDGADSIDYKSKIQLPDGTTPKIIAIQDEPDEKGNSYYKCIYT